LSDQLSSSLLFIVPHLLRCLFVWILEIWWSRNNGK
jgi:hypothetical protein